MKDKIINTTLEDLINKVSSEVEQLHLTRNRKKKLIAYIVSDILTNSKIIRHGVRF